MVVSFEKFLGERVSLCCFEKGGIARGCPGKGAAIA
jgi:hypothetical protein